MNNGTVVFAIRRLMSRSMWRFFYEMNPEYRKSESRKGGS